MLVTDLEANVEVPKIEVVTEWLLHEEWPEKRLLGIVKLFANHGVVCKTATEFLPQN